MLPVVLRQQAFQERRMELVEVLRAQLAQAMHDVEKVTIAMHALEVE
jgi:hypothetical protein